MWRIALIWTWVVIEVYACWIEEKASGFCQGSVHGHSWAQGHRKVEYLWNGLQENVWALIHLFAQHQKIKYCFLIWWRRQSSDSASSIKLLFLSFPPFSCALVFPAGSPSRMTNLAHEKRTVLLLLVDLSSYDSTYHYFNSCFKLKCLPVCVLKLYIINNYNSNT